VGYLRADLTSLLRSMPIGDTAGCRMHVHGPPIPNRPPSQHLQQTTYSIRDTRQANPCPSDSGSVEKLCAASIMIAKAGLHVVPTSSDRELPLGGLVLLRRHEGLVEELNIVLQYENPITSSGAVMTLPAVGVLLFRTVT
jgi:hypothetical protein